jgi:hypothetical protein
MKDYKILIANQALMGVFTYDSDLYKTPFAAAAKSALYCVAGFQVKRDTPLATIDGAMNTANKALTFANSSFSVAVVFGAHWSACLPEVDLHGLTMGDLPQLLCGSYFSRHYTTLRADKWHKLRDNLPSMFDLWRDNEPEDKAATFRVITTASAALAGLEVSKAEALELDEFLQHWDAE